MIGFFTAVTKVISPDAMKKALPGAVPNRFIDINIEAFDRGYNYGLEQLQNKKSPKKKEAVAVEV